MGEEKDKEKKHRKKLSIREPLVLLGVLVLVVGAVLIVYGLIPQQQPQYKLLPPPMQVPINDNQGNFVVDPETYFRAHFTGSGSVDNVQCAPNSAGWMCYGYEITGTRTVYSMSSQIYGSAMGALGLFSIYADRRFGPLRPKKPLGKSLRIRVDEDICVANGVCIALAPTVFQFKKQKSPTIFAPVAYVVDPLGANNATILQAAEMCPTGAIIIEDEETGERIHPPPPKS
ncbi:MAG TPA: ferredoxin [Nitrososphaerales archaeon]|nr:ferredoxin [Nitrososphaerales archaeon]